MHKRVALVVAVVAWGLLGTVEAARAAVLCRNKTSSVVIARATACKRGEAKLDVSQMIVDGALAGSKLADGAITESKLAAGVAPKFLSLSVFGAFIRGGASFSVGTSAHSGLVLPDNTFSDFAVGFTVPPNYTPATPLTVRILWHTTANPCLVEFLPIFLSVARAGDGPLTGPSSAAGLSVVGGTPIPVAASNQTVETLVTITSPVAGVDLAPGDAINFGMYRNGADIAADTCAASMIIQGLSVEYR